MPRFWKLLLLSAVLALLTISGLVFGIIWLARQGGLFSGSLESGSAIRGSTASARNDGLEGKYSRDVLPASTELLKRKLQRGDAPIEVAHDTPEMQQRVGGPYSYLGAAREFKFITGLDLPDWVQPLEGDYDIVKRSAGLICDSRLTYRMDASLREELAAMITAALRARWPKRASFEFAKEGLDQKTPRALFMGFELYDEVKNVRDFDVRILMFADGRVLIVNNRGPRDD